MTGGRSGPAGEDPAARVRPEPPAATVPWAGGRAVLDGIGIYLVATVATVLLAQLVTAVVGSPGDSPVAVLVAASPVATLAVAVAWLWLRYGAGAPRVAAGRARWSDVGVGVGVGLVCFVGQQLLLVAVVALLTRLGATVPPVQDTFRSVAADRATAPVLVVTAVVLAPLAEELVFRGVLFRGLAARHSFTVAALGSAGLFTLAHLGDGGGPVADLIILVGILPLGVAFAAVMRWRSSLLACAVSHGVYNAGGVALLILSAGAPPV